LRFLEIFTGQMPFLSFLGKSAPERLNQSGF